eukprot:TRINITY_DN16280_c0_g1_i2.p1 TRINITY_DN16280_c0_g1~~TRINITY_DN16280_c0_g1_i2.p1  ORF type:complete len:193 (+),score=16.14 TRINITY_DN16280_c0_g1_i2:16-594(+)
MKLTALLLTVCLVLQINGFLALDNTWIMKLTFTPTPTGRRRRETPDADSALTTLLNKVIKCQNKCVVYKFGSNVDLVVTSNVALTVAEVNTALVGVGTVVENPTLDACDLLRDTVKCTTAAKCGGTGSGEALFQLACVVTPTESPATASETPATESTSSGGGSGSGDNFGSIIKMGVFAPMMVASSLLMSLL